MSFDFNRVEPQVRPVGGATFDEGLRRHMLSVYNYMAGGVALSGVVAWLVANVPALTNLFYVAHNGRVGPSLLGWAAIFAPLLFLWIGMGARAFYSVSAQALQTRFWIFAGLIGLSLSSVFLIYTGASVARVFFISAGMFAGTSLIGYTTKRDLTGFGHFLIMGLIGLILASLVNMLFPVPGLGFAISIIGVLLFLGLTAYDTQRIKESYAASYGEESNRKMAIFGALSLYLNFINLFQFLLSIMGTRRD